MKKFLLYQTIPSFLLLFLLLACGGGSTNQESNITKESIVGYLIDAPISNMSYQCGEKRAKTDLDGKFECSSLPVKFMVGDIEVATLYTLPSDFIVYPQDLVGVSREDIGNPEVLKVASFLQSLDGDGDLSTTIDIPDNIFIHSTIKVLLDMTQNEITQLLIDNNIKPVTPQEAEQHLRENILGQVSTPTATTPSTTSTPIPSSNGTSTSSSTPTVVPTPPTSLLKGVTLPPIPSDTITNYLTPTNSLRVYDTLRIKSLLKETPLIDNSSCNLSEILEGDRVKIGGDILNSDGDSECKVRVIDSGSFEFLTKTTNSIHTKLQGSPAWAEFRFLVPQGYTADKFSYEISWYRLFGSYPSECDDREKDADGECEYKVDESWQDNIDAGVFILWATRGDSSYTIINSDEVAKKLGYSSTKKIVVDVPEKYRDKQDLTVTLFIYNQYSGGCDIDNSSQCKGASYRNLSLHSVSLESYKAFEKKRTPPTSHPRVFGSNQEWLEYMKPLDEMGCVSTNNNRDTDWGGVTNVKNLWDRYTKGGALCNSSSFLKPSSLYDERDAKFYLNHSTDKWSRNRALRIMHLLRRERYCYSQNGQNCLYPKSEIEQLEKDFIDYEIDRFLTIKWEGHGIGFSIESEPPMKFWSLFLDIFWSDLSLSQKEPIQKKMSQKIEAYLSQIAQKHWSIANGNNWNPILGKGALYWAITNYYEDSRSQTVIQKTLEIMELHRDFYMEDGAYKEGIVEYTNVSYSNLREINNLLMQSFNRPLKSMDWQNIQKTTDWFLNFMSPDGAMVDFGDSWEKRGWGTADPLYMLLWEEMTGVKRRGEAEIDSCKVKEYFDNVYYDHVFYDPWSVQPSIARDWQTIADECTQTDEHYIRFHLFPKGGMGAIRINNPNTTNLAKDSSNDRYKQANQTYLSVSAVPNEFPHREMDFGALIWSAYGNRLLYDFGYGEIGKRYSDLYKIIDSHGVNHIDDLPLGANTLVIPEALYNNDPNTNMSQILNKKGTIKKEKISEIETLHLDGSLVYGKDDDSGWLDYFHRWLIPLESGNFLIVDSFKVKDNRPDANVTEYWYSKENSNYDISQGCKYQDEFVEMSLSDNHTLLLKPRCSMLKNNYPAEVVGKITALSLEGGEFIKDSEPITMINRLNRELKRDRVRFVPNSPVREDIRLFLLSASINEANLTNETVRRVDCGDNRCFEIKSLNQTLRIELDRRYNEYRVIALD